VKKHVLKDNAVLTKTLLTIFHNAISIKKPHPCLLNGQSGVIAPKIAEKVFSREHVNVITTMVNQPHLNFVMDKD